MRRHRSAAVLAFGLAIVSIVAGARAMQGPGARNRSGQLWGSYEKVSVKRA